MKNLYLTLILALGIFGTQSIKAQNEFITLWVPSNGVIVIPTDPLVGNYSYNVTWRKLGDANPLGNHNNITLNDTITGGLTPNANDTIEVKISGNFPSFYMNNTTYKNELIDITQWGNIQWQSFKNSFYGCSNLKISATDTPDLSNVISMEQAFRQTTNFNSYIGDWDVSNIANMSAMFYDAITFNQDISGWNLTNVTDLGAIFFNASAFNQNIGLWDVSNIQLMDNMLKNATSFNHSLEDWDLSNLNSAYSRFSQLWNEL